MEQVVERFHKRHEELYTYSAPGQDVVLVNVRAAVIGRAPGPARRAVAARGRGGRAAEPSRLPRAAGWRCPVYAWTGCRRARRSRGPAIFESATTTVLIRARERAVVTAEGWLDIRLS